MKKKNWKDEPLFILVLKLNEEAGEVAKEAVAFMQWGGSVERLGEELDHVEFFVNEIRRSMGLKGGKNE